MLKDNLSQSQTDPLASYLMALAIYPDIQQQVTGLSGKDLAAYLNTGVPDKFLPLSDHEVAIVMAAQNTAVGSTQYNQLYQYAQSGFQRAVWVVSVVSE